MSKFWRLLRILYGKPQSLITLDEALQIAHRYIKENGYTLIDKPEINEELEAYRIDLWPNAHAVNYLFIDFADGHIINHIVGDR